MLQKKKYLVPLILSGLGLLIYWPGLQGPYYADDFKFLFDEPSSEILQFFLNPNPNLAMYRPLESMILAIIQSLAGSNTLPIHLLVLSLHVALSWCVYSAALRLNFSPLQAALGALYMLFSQANAMAVLGNDTLSQVAGTTLGFLSLWYFYEFLLETKTEGGGHFRNFAVSLFSFMLSLLFKETSLSFVLSLVFIAVVVVKSQTTKGLGKTSAYLFPYLLLAALYISLRSFAVSGQATDRYDFLIGFNIVENLAMLVLSTVLPVSSVTAYIAFAEDNLLLVSFLVAVSIAMGVLVLHGLSRSGLPLTVLLLSSVAVGNLLPIIFLRHVSELYVYNSMPAIALLFGYGSVSFFRSFETKLPLRILAVMLAVLLFFNHGYAVHSKARLAAANGYRASALIKQIIPYVDRIPRGGTLILINPKPMRPEYSVFLMEGFNVLNYGTHILKQIAKRDDIRIWIVDSDESGQFIRTPDSLVLTLIQDQVVIGKDS